MLISPDAYRMNAGDKFSDYLRQHLSDRSISQKELAGLVGVSAVTISRIMNLQSIPHPSTLTKLAKAFNLEERSIKKLQELRAQVLESSKSKGVSSVGTSKVSTILSLKSDDPISENRKRYYRVKLVSSLNESIGGTFEMEYAENRVVIDLYHSGRRIGVQSVEKDDASPGALAKLADLQYEALRPKRLIFVFGDRDPRIGGFREVVKHGNVTACKMSELSGIIKTVA